MLIIDDNVDAAELLGILLRNSGCDVTTAATGRAGLEAARQREFEVVLLDIGLPDLDGRQVARRLRKTPSYKDTCLIAVSGYTQQRDLVASKEAGFDAHLGKPVSQDELRNIIAVHCDLPSQPRDLPADATPAKDLPASTKNGYDTAAGPRRSEPEESPEILELFRQLDHDLRTPLSSIELSGWALDGMEEASGETTGIGARLLRASELMTKVIDRAHDLATLIVHGEVALQREPADLCEVVESALEQHPLAGEEPLPVSVSSHGPLYGNWDVARFRSVLTQIISHSCADSPLGLSISLTGAENTVTIELDLQAELPALEKYIFGEIDNLDSLHMDLNYAHWLVRAHAGSTTVDRLAGHTVVRFELPRHR